MSTTTLTAAELKTIRERIAELEATPRALVATDEGTHAEPALHYVYEEITGERYATRSFGGANATRLESEADAAERTTGRMRHLTGNQTAIRESQTELKALRRKLDEATAS